MINTVKVKPLEWVPTKLWNRNDYHGTEPMVIEYVSVGTFPYTLRANYQIGNSWNAWRDKSMPIKNGSCVSFEEAKAAAQADYEQRILSALEASPAPQLAEAVKRKREEISQHIHIDMASSAMFVASVQAEALEGIAIPLIEELSRRPSTQWGDIVFALRDKAKAIKEEAGVFDGEYCPACGQGPDACGATGCTGAALTASESGRA